VRLNINTNPAAIANSVHVPTTIPRPIDIEGLYANVIIGRGVGAGIGVGAMVGAVTFQHGPPRHPTPQYSKVVPQYPYGEQQSVSIEQVLVDKQPPVTGGSEGAEVLQGPD
jgi:hypothetical protein